jgi:hypothetical protein
LISGLELSAVHRQLLVDLEAPAQAPLKPFLVSKRQETQTRSTTTIKTELKA